VPRTSRSLAAVFLLHLSALAAYSAGGRDRWDLVRQLPHDASFTFIDRDRACHFGQVSSVTDQTIVVNTGKSKETLQRSALLYVQRGHYTDPYAPLAVMYSGRSSWADILVFMPLLTKYPSLELRMTVMTASGKLIKGNLKQVTENEIVLRDEFGKETQVPRTEVSRVDYIQSKPLSDKQEFDWEELAMLRIFDPVLYPRLFHAGDTMSVGLYDRASNQDDSPLACK
jgi:hypothetical protein